jgi:hypothetical protein
MARPPKLDDKLTEKVCTYIKAGSFLETACPAAGINSRTLRLWMAEAARNRSEGRATRYTKFADAVERALAEAEVRDAAEITKAGKGDWRALAWIMERKYRARWGFKQEITVKMQQEVERILDVIQGVVDGPTFEAIVDALANAPNPEDG